MSADIKLFSNDFSGADSRLKEFLRNQPGNRPPKQDARKDRRGDGLAGHQPCYQHADNADARQDAGGNRMQ